MVALRFWQWTQYNSGDTGLVQIATQFSTNWTTLAVAVTNGTSTAWKQFAVDLSAYQGQQVQIGFLHLANSDRARLANTPWHKSLIPAAITGTSPTMLGGVSLPPTPTKMPE